MRLVIAAGLALAAPQAGFAQEARPPAARIGEVLLEVDATGAARVAADVAHLFVTMTCKGDTLQQAEARSAALVAKMKAAARSAGVGEADLIVSSQPGPLARVDLTDFDEEAEPALGSGKHSVRTTIEVRLRDLRRWEDLRNALLGAGAPSVGDPTYSLSDDRAARMAAKLDAIGRARTDAEAYADRLGMRVGRIVKVSDRTRTDFGDLEYMQQLMRSMREEGRSDSREIETRAKVSVDFILVPRS